MANLRSLPWAVCLLVLGLALSAALSPARAAESTEPVVRGVLFHSPTCGHCEKVLTQDIPPLQEKYGPQMQLFLVNVSVAEGRSLYQSALASFHVSADRSGVPALYIGDQILYGSAEIPEKLPGILEEGLKQGGVDWPSIPGLYPALASKNMSTEPIQQDGPAWWRAFQKDPVGNTIAVVVLLFMVATLALIAFYFLGEMPGKLLETASGLPVWVVPVLCFLGLIAAGYLSYTEITNTDPVCGPLEGCGTVQQSKYATLWGFLPVGVLGLFGYVSILATWLAHRFGPPAWTSYTTLALWGLSLIGVLFSTYLTFLEPFVIGATCLWCIINAIVITLLLWATTGPAFQASNDLAGD